MSKRVADDLGQLGRWAKHLHDLGEATVKHGVRLHVLSFYTDEVGNSELPSKLRPTKQNLRSLKRALRATAVVIALIVLALGVFWLAKLRSRNAQSASATPGATASRPTPLPSRTFSYSMVVQKYRNGKPWSNPKDLGEIKDARQNKSVREFLAQFEGSLAEGKKD